MNLYLIEEDSQIVDGIKNMVDKYLDKVNVIKVRTTELSDPHFNPEPPSLILFDLDCHQSNTLALFETLHQKTTIPIVVIDDVNTGANRLIKALQLGASEYLFKPISNSHLISVIVPYLKVGLSHNLLGG